VHTYVSEAPEAVAECPYCGSKRINIIPTESVPTHAFSKCVDCQSNLGFCQTPAPEVWALSLRLWFGKHEGLSISEILRADRQYVVWMSENGYGRVREAAQIALAQR
jgi:hypothetical protein